MDFTDRSNLSEFKHISWIPCVTGKLAFNYLEPKHCILHKPFIEKDKLSAKVGKEKKRYATCIFHANTEDFKKTSFSGKWLNFAHVEQCKKGSESKLKGRLYWWIENGNNTEKIKLKLRKKLQTLQTKNIQAWESNWNAISQNTEDTPYEDQIYVDFEITTSGLMLIKEAVHSSKNHNNLTLNSENKGLFARQTFYIIKQCLHAHKHHETTDDAITTTHEIDQIFHDFPDNPGLPLLHDLKHALTNLQRTTSSNYEQLSKTNGIASYAKSLCESLFRARLISDKTYNHNQQFIDNTKSSISTQSDMLQLKIEEKSRILDSKRNKILLFLAIVTPQLVLFKEAILKAITTKHGHNSDELIIVETLSWLLVHPSVWISLIISYFILPHLSFPLLLKKQLSNIGFIEFVKVKAMENKKNIVINTCLFVLSIGVLIMAHSLKAIYDKL